MRVANLLCYISTKYYQYRSKFEKVTAKTTGGQLLSGHVYNVKDGYDDTAEFSNHLHLCFNGRFPGEPGLPWFHSLSSSICSRREPLEIRGTRFLWAGCPYCQPTRSVKSLKETQSTDPDSGLDSSFFIHHRTLEGSSVTPFMPPLRRQYQFSPHQWQNFTN